MADNDDSEEIKDLIKRKTKLIKDPHRLNELGDVVFRIGYLYYHKGYYKESLEEFENALEIRKKLSVNVDIAVTHRFLGETLCKLGENFERAKLELDMYYSMTLRVNDLVEIQRALTTLGNYYMTLAENNYKSKRMEHLNEAYSHYLKSYDILNEIWEKKLVDSKEFGLMKARTCLNCAFAMDEKRDLIICNEYLKTAIEICEANHFYEDLIRCLYIKCDQAKRKNKMEDMLKTADRIIQATLKSKDHVQQSHDYLFVAEIYIKIQNLEKAKNLLRKAYRLKKKCMINPEITQKLKHVMNIIRSQKEIITLSSSIDEIDAEETNDEKNINLLKIYEKLGDSYCGVGLYENGLESYLKQLKIAKKLKSSQSEMALIYSSIGQTYQDLEDYANAVKYFQLELNTNTLNLKSQLKSYFNQALLKEKLQVEYGDLKSTYLKALDIAKQLPEKSYKYQLKVLKCFKESQITYGISCDDTNKTIKAVNEVSKIKGEESDNDEDSDTESEEEENGDNESLTFSSDSDIENQNDYNNMNDEENLVQEKLAKCKKNNVVKKSIVRRNLRGETQLHVACIKGNFKMAKKLIEEGHPVNERDNLNWLPIHEASNYGFADIVDLLIKHGAKINDSIGPITPLHDASQNGHFEVVKLLLKAGALPYTFTQEGYTPLDFLVKYKEDNEKKMSQADLALYKELHEFMMKSILSKDKMYKIKKVIYNDDCIADNESGEVLDEDEFEIKKSSSSKTNSGQQRSTTDRLKSKNEKMNNLLYFDEDDNEKADSDEDDITNRKKDLKRKKAVKEYKQVMSSIGKSASKSTDLFNSKTSDRAVFTKKSIDKCIVTETEYDMNDDWLINDTNNHSKNLINDHKIKFSSTKRKYSTKTDDEENADNEADYLDYSQYERKKDELEMKQQYKKTSPPTSKKRLIESESNSHMSYEEQFEYSKDSLTNLRLNEAPNNNDIFQEETNSNPLNELSSNSLKKKDKSSSNNLNSNYDSYMSSETNDENDDFVSFMNKKKEDSNAEIIIESPFKKTETNTLALQNVRKKQLKLTKMLSKSNEINEPMSNSKIQFKKSQEINQVEINEKKSTKQASKSDQETVSQQNWKIKANIDNRNFLIPVSNVNSTIDELTKQIVTRYKVIFSNDPSYREPNKVILKNSDDLILFGQDLITDVLTNLCQVQLVVESWKDAPSIQELYEQACQSKNLSVYSDIKSTLIETETELKLTQLLIENEYMSKQFQIVFESIKSSCKHNNYVKSLCHIDLSSNMINDEIFVNFVENVLIECNSLKVLNLCHNLLTLKGVKALMDLAHSVKTSGKSTLFFENKPLENLSLNGNDIGFWTSSTTNIDTATVLANLINLFQASLQILNVSDCKINFDCDNHSNSREENSIKKFFNTVKNSNLTEIDVSYNKFNVKSLTDFVDFLPGCKIEHLNLSNALMRRGSDCKNETILKYEEKKAIFNESIIKFIPFNLRHVSFRNLNFNNNQTNDIINGLTSCSQLKSIDLSFNSFDANLIRLLFTECSKIEEASLINNSLENSSTTNWKDIISLKFDEQSTGLVALKRLELKLEFQNEKYELKNLFRKKWNKNSIKIKKFSKNIVEFLVV